MEEQIGFVYILTNKAYPGLLKIGFTLKQPEERAQELSSATGVPLRFELAYAVETFFPKAKEKVIHDLLSKYRVSGGKKKTEFFRVNFEKAKHTIDMVVSPPDAPTPPGPPELTLEQKEQRSEIIKLALKEKFLNRIKSIDAWIRDFQLFVDKERTCLDMRGFIRRTFFPEPKETLETIRMYEDAIQKIEELKEAYTLEVFLKEHESVRGVDHIANQFPSNMLKKYLGLEKTKQTRIDNFDSYSAMLIGERIEVDIFEITEACPFEFKWKSYVIQPGSNCKTKSTHNVFVHWDTAFYSNLLHPDPDSYHTLSDEQYRKNWQEDWLRKWWKRVDPDGHCASNPFGLESWIEKELR